MTEQINSLGKRLSNDSMNKQEYLLTCLAEECAEVAQRCTKALRFGINECQPGQELSNEERLNIELNDLFTICRLLSFEGVDIWPADTEIKANGTTITG